MAAAPTQRVIPGPAGNIEIAVAQPRSTALGIALIAHPHPLYGGTMDNKVVQTLARSFLAMGYAAWRMNFRGVGGSEGVFDDGRGEIEDFRAFAAHALAEQPGLPVALAGFSFGTYVVSHLAQELQPRKLVLVAPAVGRFAVANVPEDTLVIHGEEDDVVALEDVFNWARPQKLPVIVVPGAGHFFHGDLLKLQHLVTHSCTCVAE